jgi:beta-glucanase (GH16 family)
MDARNELQQEGYELIADLKKQLDRLYPILDTLGRNPVISDCNNVVPQTKNDAPAHVLSNYTLIFEDLFNNPSTPVDPNKWSTSFIWGPTQVINNEDQYYVDTLGGQGWQGANPFSRNAQGNLLITAAPIEGPAPDTFFDNGSGLQPMPKPPLLSSGMINTRDTACFKYGYAEVCLRDPCCPGGMWTAAWLLNCLYYNNAFDKNAEENDGNGTDKFNHEIDFKENVDNYGCDSILTNAYHYFTGDALGTLNRWTIDGQAFKVDGQPNAGLYKDCDGNDKTFLDTAGTTCNELHTVAVDWAPDYIHFYLNGQIVNCINGSSDLISDQFMYLIINFAAGGNYPMAALPGGALENFADVNDYPASLEVAYARIYLHPEGQTRTV